MDEWEKINKDKYINFHQHFLSWPADHEESSLADSITFIRAAAASKSHKSRAKHYTRRFVKLQKKHFSCKKQSA